MLLRLQWNREKPDTDRRASSASTASGQINRTIIPLNAAESQLSSSRTGSEPPVPLSYERDHRASKGTFWPFVAYERWCTRPGSEGPDSSRAPEAQCSPSTTLPAPKIITDGSAPSVFDPTLEYSTEQVVLFWQPPSCFSQCSPSSFVVDNVSYSYAEQFMMAEKACLFQDRRTEELIMSSPDPSALKHWSRRA